MEWINAKITNAFIGIEDHGLFAWSILFEWPGAGQGTGAFTFDADKIKEIVTIFGPWNELEGKLVRIGKEGYVGRIRDILDDLKEVKLN